MRQLFVIGVLVVLCGAGAGLGDEQEAQRLVAARVDGQSVYAALAETELRRAYGERTFPPRERERIFRAALDQVIDRRLILTYLSRTGQSASGQDVDLALAQFEKDLASQNLTLDQHLKEVGLTREEVRQSLAWKLSWQRYLTKYLTAQNLEKYFDRYRREFDGTQLRVAQILLKLPADADDVAVAAMKSRAAGIRQEIASGQLTFAEAARRHSQAPSGKEGGDIGWIERHRPSPEDFSRTAYALKKGEVSQPLVSPFGVHLVTVLEEKPGQMTWRDAEAELRPAVTLYLFRWIADQERAKAKIEYLP